MKYETTGVILAFLFYYDRMIRKCEHVELYCKLFTMGHCIISLTVAKRFEMGDQVEIEPICIKGATSDVEDQGPSKTRKRQGYFVLS